MLIAIDIDETIYPLMDEWIQLYYANTGHKLTIEDFTSYGIHRTMNQLPREQVYGMLDWIEYKKPPYENAVNTINAFASNPANRIVFHSTVHNMQQAILKLEFLKCQFTTFEWDVIFGNKGISKMQYITDSDIIIEDSPENATYILNHCPETTKVILLERPYTKEAPTHERIFNAKDWFEVASILNKLGA